MKRLTLASSIIIGLYFSQSGGAQTSDLNKLSNQQIVTRAPEIHPAALYVLAARLLAEGKGQEAANWMYAGQLRYRVFITATKQSAGNSEMPLFGALTEQVGRPVNEYVAGDPDEWIAAIDWALDWDESNPNTLVDKRTHATTIKEVRAGLVKLRTHVDSNREEIRRQRTENGLENR
ncbi:hypothetical protein AAIB41_07390 [Brucella sp. BE17]|uniref:hypothetical protein n=1 Tax=Brucella sp. BE17 TaxID=3142977 RepID=UPI0031BB539B